MKRSSSCRLRKVECDHCGYVARVTRSWLNVGLPSCPCGGKLEPTDAADRAYVGLLECEDVPAPVWTAICRVNGWEDSILRRGAAAKAWERSPASRLGERKAGAGHCAYPGCGRWIADGADVCTAGHPQRDGVELEPVPF